MFGGVCCMVVGGQTKGKAVKGFGFVCPLHPLRFSVKINPLDWETAVCLKTLTL